MIFRVPKQLGDGEVQFLHPTIPLTLINLSRLMIIGVFISGFYVVSVLQHHGSSCSNHVHHFKSDLEPCLYFKPICLLFCLQFGMCTWFSMCTISHRALNVLLSVEDVHVVICNVCGSALVQHSFHARSDAFIQYTSYVNSIMLVSCVMRS